MRLPRDLTGAELVKRLVRLGYRVTRQTGNHLRLTCDTPHEHHVTIPKHDPLRVGTLAAILTDIADHHRLRRDELVKKLFGDKR
jgi:Predicted periplasmic or secreted lipoprotein